MERKGHATRTGEPGQRRRGSPKETPNGGGRRLFPPRRLNLDGEIADGALKRHTVRGCAPLMKGAAYASPQASTVIGPGGQSGRQLAVKRGVASPQASTVIGPGGQSGRQLAVKRRLCRPISISRNRSLGDNPGINSRLSNGRSREAAS